MKARFILHLATAALAAILASCSTEYLDPDFIRESSSFHSNPVPDSIVVGKWMSYDSNSYGMRFKNIERRIFLDFRTGGRGTVRVVSRDLRTEAHSSMEAEFRWFRKSENLWRVELPEASRFRSAGHSGGGIDTPPAPRPFFMKYSRGRLYNVSHGRVIVPLSEAKRHTDQQRARATHGPPDLINTGFEW